MQRAGEIIRRVRKFRGIKARVFAGDVGISPPTLYRLEHDDPRVDLDTIARAAQLLGIQFDYASRLAALPAGIPQVPATVARKKNGFPKSAEQFLRDRGIDPEPQPEPEPTREVAASPMGMLVLGEVAASGFIEPRIYHSDDEQERIPLLLPQFPNAVALRVVGDSMMPTYAEGDYLVCVPVEPADVRLGDDVVIQCDGGNDGRSTFKRVFGKSDDTIKLKPLNGKHKPVQCKLGDVARVLRVEGTYRPRVRRG